MAVSSKIPSELDLELLSAYLDGELSDREKKMLEQRLTLEGALRAELDGLRETVALVRDLPRLKAPRDFTLDPAVYARPAPWWKRLSSFEVALQLSGALGAAASVVLIVAAVLVGQGAGGDGTGRGAERPLADQAAPAQPPEIAMQGTATEFARTPAAEPEETAIAFTGEDFQSTAVAQSNYYATHYPSPTLLPSPIFKYTPSPFGDTTLGEAATLDEAGPALESAAADQAEMPPAAPDSEGGPAVMGAENYPPAEPSYAAGAGAAPAPLATSPPPPAAAAFAPPSATVEEGLLTVPQVVASPAEGGFRERDSDEEETGETQGQDGASNLPTGEASAAVTATPAEVAQAAEDDGLAMKDESREEAEDGSESWWQWAVAGLVLFALSSVMFIVGRRWARG